MTVMGSGMSCLEELGSIDGGLEAKPDHALEVREV
jgi:hypothetical protein